VKLLVAKKRTSGSLLTHSPDGAYLLGSLARCMW
jgi:hypothetical protein